MKTHSLRAVGCWWVVLLCGLLLGAAYAQDTALPLESGKKSAQETNRSAANAQDTTGSAQSDDGKTTTFDTPARDDDQDDDQSKDDWADGHHQHRFHSRNDDVVSIGHSAELAAGEHAHEVVAVFGSATSAGDVDNAVVSVLGSSRVTGGKVGDATVAVLGSVYVNGEVNGEVVAVLGNVELGPEAKVHGNVVIIGGGLKRDPKATLEGHVQNVFGVDWADFGWVRPWIERCLFYGRPLAFSSDVGWAWGIALGLLALYAFIAFLFRGAVDACVHTLETQPGHVVLAALLVTLGVPVLFVLLFITVLGIIAVPFLAVALICAAMLGKIVVLAAIGKRCTPTLARDPTLHTVAGVVVAGLIMMVIYTIPVVGFLVYKLLELLGLGVVVYTLLLSVRAGRLTGAAPHGPQPFGPTPWPGATQGPPPGLDPQGSTAPGATPWPGATKASASGPGPQGWSSGQAPPEGSSPGQPPPEGSSLGQPPPGGVPPPFGAPSEGAPHWKVPPGSPPPGASSEGTSHWAPPPGASAEGPPHGAPPGVPPSPLSFNGATLPRAGFAIRMGALLLDVVLIGIMLHQVNDHDIELLVLAGYGAVMWKLKGSTVGGIICGLRVVRIDGRPIDWPTAIVRALGCFLSLAVVGLGFIWIAIDSDRQSWHDKIAGTVVVRAPKGASLL